MFYIAAGFGVGFAIGLTGIGGGTLMTPILLLFGFPVNIAIGTDLVYAALTKTSGAFIYHRLQKVDWGVVGALCAGSLPSTLVTIYLLKYMFSGSDHYSLILTNCLGFMLCLSALFIFVRDRLVAFYQGLSKLTLRQRYFLTVLAGALLGFLVTLSSIGAGVVGTAVVLMLYPGLKSDSVIGTEIAHAVPLALVAGIGHIWLGNIDFLLLGGLLLGSLPAIYLGARVNQQISDSLLRMVLAVFLFIFGVHYIF